MSIGASPQMSNFPLGFSDGITLRNVPITPVQPGRVFWVYNGTNLPPGGAGGSDNNRGTFLRPFATIAGALAQCLAGRGDIVFVKPGHSETIGASGLAMNVAGVQVIGLGIGTTRPTLTLNATASPIAVSAAQMAIRNFQLDFTGIDAVAVGSTVTAADFHLTDCYVKMATATAQATLGVSSSAAASGMIVNGCKFLGTSDAGTTAAVQFVGGDNLQITNNTMMGGYGSGVGGISNLTTAATNVLIAGNYISNLTAVSTKAITVQATTTGFISDNRMQILSGTAPITAAAMSWAGGNYYAATIATAGTLI
jgi:hypothetical protein